MSGERRATRRFLIWIPVRLDVEGETVEGRIYDISGRGGFVWCDQIWPVGTKLRLWLDPPGAAESLRLQSQVVRVEEGEGLQGMAVVFTNVEESAAAFIRLFLDMQERSRHGRSGARG
jgi:hypothetical protein